MPDTHVNSDKIQEIIEMLIEAGIHMDAVNADGMTAARICTTCK